jgi:Domain of unknown function (DUF4440)
MVLMRLLLLVLAISPLAQACAQTSNSLPQPIEIVTQEQHLWTTFAEGDFDTVRSLFTPDYIRVDSSIQALDTTLVFLKHCKLTSYELRDLQVRILTPDSAITAYRVLSSFDCKSQKPETKSFDNNSLTVWIRHPGSTKWLAQAHAETPVASTQTSSPAAATEGNDRPR